MEQVTRVYDGDSFATNLREIRLASVNTPEEWQLGYEDAKNALINLIGGKSVDVIPVATDDYGRTVAYVTILDIWGNVISVNVAMKQYE